MIFLKSANILFLKPRKVAGTSFEIALSKFAGPQDIITPIDRADELIRQKLGHHGPQNYQKQIKDYRAGDLKRALMRRAVPPKFFNHIEANAARERLGADVFDHAFKLTIVRNPYETLVSLYHFSTRGQEHPLSFSDWVRRNPDMIAANDQQYYVDGENIVDQFLRYEHLLKDIEMLERNFDALRGLKKMMENIRAKGSIRPKGRSLTEYYSDPPELAPTVQFLNKRVIELFNYQLD